VRQGAADGQPLARRQLLLFIFAFALYWLTLYPSFYNFDSAELAIGATELGIVHSPGYALYLLIAHVFTWLPIGDVGYRLNLLSALYTALTVPILWTGLFLLIGKGRASALVALCFVLCVTVWLNGTVTEVYAAQTLTLAISFWAIMRLRPARTIARALAAGAAFGVAVAMHPSSVFFAPAVALAFVGLRVRWHLCIGAALLALLIFATSLFYFPLRQDAQPRMNFAGQYDDSGQFVPVDLATVEGLTWLIRGDQFADLFFAEGYLPSQAQLGETLTSFWNTYQGIGLLIGVVGIVVLARRRLVFVVWMLAFLPYTYFYTTYGAPDKTMMLNPSYLLMSVPLVYGFAWGNLNRQLRHVRQVKEADTWRALRFNYSPIGKLLWLLVPALMAVNSLVQLGIRLGDDVRGEATAIIDAMPQDAVVFGVWGDIVPLEYLQLIDGQRVDLTLRNLFFFDSQEGVIGQIARLTEDAPSRPIVFLSSLVPTGLDARQYTIYPLRVDGESVGFVFVPR
jgi:hypothetical protein